MTQRTAGELILEMSTEGQCFGVCSSDSFPVGWAYYVIYFVLSNCALVRQ